MGALDLSRYLWPDAVEGRQPQYPAGIDQENSITKGLRVAVIGGSTFDYVSKTFLASTGISSSLATPGKVSKTSNTAGDKIVVPFEITGAVSIHFFGTRGATVPTSGPNTVATIASNRTAGQGTFWECNLGNGFGAAGDKDKPRFSTNAVGIGTIYADGVALSGNNPATTALTNGQFYNMSFVASSGASSSGSGQIYLLGEAGLYALNGGSALILIWDRALSAVEVAALASNPWQVFTAPMPIWIGVASAAGAALSGNAAGQAGASASLTTAIPVTAAALGISTASAALSTAIPLSGVAVSVSSASGALTAQVSLSAAALAQALSSAALASGIIMTASAVAQAAAQGTLATAIQMIANAAGQASATASLTAGSGLAANAQATASASAALTVQIQLSATALAQAAASASLTASGSGLSANAAAAATAQGSVTTQIRLTAAALAEAIASGGLVTSVQLAANAAGQVTASGQLDGIVLAADPRFTVALPARSFSVALPARSFTVSHKG